MRKHHQYHGKSTKSINVFYTLCRGGGGCLIHVKKNNLGASPK